MDYIDRSGDRGSTQISSRDIYVTPRATVTRTLQSDLGVEDVLSLWAEAEVSAKALSADAVRYPVSDKSAGRLVLSDSLTVRTRAPDPSEIQAPPVVPGGTQETSAPEPEPIPAKFSLFSSTPPDPRRVAAGVEGSPIIARRPVAGIAPLRNTFATLEIVARGSTGSKGNNYVPVLNSSYNAGTARGTSNFLIHSVTEIPPASVTITRTLTSSLLTSIGREPSVVQMVGFLVGSKDFPWISEWRRNYDLYLSADQCLLRKAQIYLTVDNVMYVGYMIGTTLQRSTREGSSWQVCAFNFDFFVTKVVDLALVESSEDVGRWLPQISRTIRGSDLDADIPDEERASLGIRRATEILYGGDGEREFEFDLQAGTSRPLDDFGWALTMAGDSTGRIGSETVEEFTGGGSSGIPDSVLDLPPNLSTVSSPTAYV